MGDIARALLSKQDKIIKSDNYLSLKEDRMTFLDTKTKKATSKRSDNTSEYNIYKRLFGMNAVDIINMSKYSIIANGSVYSPLPNNKITQKLKNWIHKDNKPQKKKTKSI